MSDNKIRVSASVPGLKDKVRINLPGTLDIVHWYIRFNIPLDEATVNDHTMQVTDTDGYIMRTDISYQSEQNRICISPLDSYEENRFYLLNISKKVCSARGRPLKTTIHILFKLYKQQVSEYKVLRDDVELPKPVARPENYDDLQATRAPSALEMQFDEKKAKELLEKRARALPAPTPNDRMETVRVHVNLWTGLAGLTLVLLGFALEALWVVALAAGVCVIGAVHLFVQLRDKELASKMHYNAGVKAFNRQQFAEARAAFEKALQVYPKNIPAKYGLDRTKLIK